VICAAGLLCLPATPPTAVQLLPTVLLVRLVVCFAVCRYKEAAHARYAGWTTQECTGRECLLVHAQAGLEVDLVAVRQLLQRKLPGLLAGQSVQQLAEPWPPAD
jgi:hypothetical protein